MIRIIAAGLLKAKFYISVMLVFVCLCTFCRANDGQLPKIEFTKIQDLNLAKDRPIKDKWAVVIGASGFTDQRLNNGLSMDKAALDFYNYLTDENAGRFDKNHVKLLQGFSATRQGILAAVGHAWLGQVAGPDDLVLVFVGTHGYQANDGKTYLCAQNTMLNNIFATGIAMEDFMQVLKKNVQPDRIVIVMQACHSGAAELNSGAKALFPSYNIDLDKLSLGRGYIIISSSRPDQISWGDIFSRNLVQALRKNNGMISLNQAFEIARGQTEYQSTHSCVSCKLQTPIMKSDWTGKDLILGVPPLKQGIGIPSGVSQYLNAEAVYVKANNLVVANKLDEAIEEYKKTIAIDPEYADAYNDYASTLTLKQEWSQAEKLYKQAIKFCPTDELYHANYARVLSKLGKEEQALSELQTAYRLNSKDRTVLIALADRSRREGELAKASLYLKEALALYPGSSDLHDRLGYVLTQEAQGPGGENYLDLALYHAREAVKLDPNSYSAQLNLGSILLLKGDASGAESEYRKALSLDRTKPDGYFLLSSVLEQVNNYTGAKEALNCFLKVCSPDDSRIELARQHLKALNVQE